MRILIFILALMSAFFVPAVYSNEPDLSDLQNPSYEYIGSCMDLSKEISSGGNIGMCQELIEAIVEKARPGLVFGSTVEVHMQTDTGPFYRIVVAYKNHYSDTATSRGVYGYFGTKESAPKCPPEGMPKYNIPVPQANNQLMCAKPKAPEDCPAGYHSKGTSAALGSDECVPQECPPSGSSESLFSSPNIGGSGFDGGGLYCNGGCAYSVDESQISLGQYAMGVSQGTACGDKPYDDKKLADDADADQCSTVSDGTVSVLQCPDHNQPDPEDNPIDNDESKVDDSETPQKEKETCAAGDSSCNIKNVETEVENSTNRQIDNDNELHNKKIEADEKNAKAFINVMDSIDTAILYQTSQDDKLHAVTVGKFNELIDAVNGIETGGGGGGGNGTGSGTGNIGGEDCEGTIEECAGIGSGDGVEIPQETRNLEQYAQKYNNWLPDAELPPEKCITLTNGKSLCFSFEYFILFFQAISGLIVISSLIHSASIIVRSV